MTAAKRAALIVSIAVVPSCVSPGGDGDREPPVLEVTAPARAQRVDGEAVLVSGRASDGGSGIASVSVGGVDAELAADGSFEAELALDGGVSLVEVVARDRAGNQARDVRAVLSGRSSADSVIAQGLMARVGPAGYRLVAEAVRAGLSAADLPASGALMAVPGCFEVHMATLRHGAIEVDLEPHEGGVWVEVAVRDVVADLRADIDGFCDPDGSSAPMRLAARTLWLRGVARVLVSDGRVRADLDGLSPALEAVDLDTSLVPAEVVDLLGDLPAELGGALGDVIGQLAAGALGDWLDDFDAVEWTTAVRGLGLTVRLAPSAVDAGLDGLAVISSVELLFDGVGPAEYIAGTPADAPPLAGDSALRVAVADDVANLTLAALWAGGLLDRSIALPDDHPARTRLGLDHLALVLPLPPMVTSRDGSARIVIGDAVVTAYDLQGNPVMQLAASALADLALSGTGGAILTLIPDEAQLWLTPLATDGGSQAALELPEPLRLVALDEMTRFLDDSLAALPLPDLTGVADVSGLAAVPGYVVLDADLAGP